MAEGSFKQLFYNTLVPMYVYDDETYDFYAVNEGAVQQYGYTEAEFLRMKATDIRPPDDVDSFIMANIGVPDQYVDLGHWRHIRKNGEMFYVHIYAHTTEFSGKKVRVVLAVDIDKKVRVESELKKKESEITSILESITDGFYALNKKWEVIYFNNTAEKILGYNREQVIGKNIWEFFPDAMQGRFYTEYNKVIKEGVSAQFEEYYAPAGVWGSMHVYPTLDGIAVYFVDITEQKKIQEKISRDEENLRAIINNTSDLIWSIDTQYNFISANDAFWDRMEPKTGKRALKLFGGDFNNETAREWAEYYDRCLTGEVFKIIRNETVEGRLIFEEISFNPIIGKNGEVAGISCFARDVTRQYLYTQMIERQNEQLKQIAWMLSHELRAPVASILGLISLFNRSDASDPVNAEVLSLLAEATTKMDDIVKNISNQTVTISDIETEFNKEN